MRKGTFMIRVLNGKGFAMEKVNGLISKDFGIFKSVGAKNTFSGYSVTHLKTGSKLAVFDLLRQARDYVDRVEKAIFPVPWDTSSNPEDFRSNAPKAIEIKDVVYRNV